MDSKGFTLVETLFIVIVFLIIMGSGFKLITVVQGNNKIQIDYGNYVNERDYLVNKLELELRNSKEYKLATKEITYTTPLGEKITLRNKDRNLSVVTHQGVEELKNIRITKVQQINEICMPIDCFKVNDLVEIIIKSPDDKFTSRLMFYVGGTKAGRLN